MDDDDVCHPFYFAVQDDTVDEELLMSLSFLLPPPAPEAEAVQQAVQESAFSAYQSAAASASSSAESLRRRFLLYDRSAIPPAHRAAINFIVGAAANYIRHLEGKKEWLRARNEELGLAPPPPARPGAVMVVKVRAESELGPMVDVFEAVLRRLKAMEELQVTAIQSCLCDGGMWMDVAVESKISSREVDKAIRNALRELQEIGPGSCLQIGSKTSFSCQVESGVLLTS
uniref:Uncharacterized protein n=1 Tax=Oryza brachyantha TaxID=4533 RepID=J3L4K5_ORYBR